MNNLLCSIEKEEKLGIELKNIKYFKEFLICHDISDKAREEIESILYIRADLFIGEMKLIRTEKMISNEGIILTGYKLRVEIMINEFFKYNTKNNNSSIGIIRNNLTKMIYITLPDIYEGKKIDELYRKKKISIKAYLEDMYCDRFKNSVDANLTILVNCNISN